MKGRRRVIEVFLCLETIETWLVYECHSEGEWERKGFKAHPFECVKPCNAAGFYTLNSFPCVSRMFHHPKDIQPMGGQWSENGSLMKEDKGG
jgi:hypothetical protein